MGGQLTQIQFGTQLVQHRSGILSAELADNLYLEQAPQGAKTQATLLSTPGLKLFAEVDSAGPVRGMIEFDNKLFVVAGTTLYKVGSAGTATAIGTVPGVGNVQMAHNGSYIWLNNTLGSLYAADNTTIIDLTSDIGEPGAPPGKVIAVAAQDGYNMAAELNSQNWYLSGLDALGNTVSGLFTAADGLTGNLVGMISDHREFLAFKTDSIEIYQNTGAVAFPFQRTQVIEQGAIATASIAKRDNSVFWLGDDLEVYAMSGYQPQPISTPAIAYLIGQRASPQAAVGWTYNQAGHDFYVLTFSDYTIVYDITTGVWHKRTSQGYGGRWRASCNFYMVNWQKHIVGDVLNGNLYELDLATYDDNGEDLVREAIGAPIWNNSNRFVVDEFVLDAEAGVGIQNSRETAWAQGTAYVVGDLVSNSNNVYKCVTAGTSLTPSDGPGGIGTSISDCRLTVVIDTLATLASRMQLHFSASYHQAEDTTNLNAITAYTEIGDTLFEQAIQKLVFLVGILEEHKQDTNAHSVDDPTTVPSVSPRPTDVAQLFNVAAALIIDFNTHRLNFTYHGKGPSTAAPTMSTSAVRWSFVEQEVRGEDPEVILDWSSDGGKTWSAQLQRSMGKIGERKQLIQWHRLGMHRNLAFRIRISEPVPVRIHGAYIRADMGTT